MRLLTVGDSFTYGDELSDVIDNITPSKFAWPEVLAGKLGWKVDNLAKPASGNTRMVRYIIENINNFDACIIGWSHYARTEIADQYGTYDIWPGCSPDPHRQQLLWRSEIIDYYTRYHNDDYLYRQYLINIILLQKYLISNNKRYLMLDAFGNHQDSRRNLSRNDDLFTQIDKNTFLGWPNESLMEWTNGSPKGSNGHFLEQGHKQVADKIYEHIRHLGWVP